MTCCLEISVIIANLLTFLIGAAHIHNSTNVHQQVKQNANFTYVHEKIILHGRNRLRGLVVFVFAHDMQIQVGLAMCKQGWQGRPTFTTSIYLINTKWVQ